MNVILVDSSYTSFYRFFATVRWFTMAKKEEYKLIKEVKNYDWSTNNIFLEKYEKMYLAAIEKIVKKKVFKDSIIIFCRDSPQETLWRNKLSSDYKGERADMTLKHNFKPTFKYTYNTIIPELVKNNDNIFQIIQPELEADDLIALATKYVKEKFKDKNIYLVSGDEDFLQLGFDKLYFANYRKKKLFQLTEEEAKEKLRLKLVCGDSSDNIKCIFPKDKKKVNNKTRKMVKESEEFMNEFLKENKEAMKNYKHNRKMIDFNYIPKKYNKDVNKKLKKIFDIKPKKVTSKKKKNKKN